MNFVPMGQRYEIGYNVRDFSVDVLNDFPTFLRVGQVLYPKFALVSILNSKCTSCGVIHLEVEEGEEKVEM